MNRIKISNQDYEKLNIGTGYDWVTAMLGNNPHWNLDKLFKTPKWAMLESHYKVYAVEIDNKIYRTVVNEENKEVYRELPHYYGRGGYHGGGRKKLPPEQKKEKKYKTVSISGTQEEMDKLKVLAETAGMTVSRYIFTKVLADGNS